MDTTQQPSQKTLMIAFIGGSVAILFILLLVIVLIRGKAPQQANTAPTTAPENTNTQPTLVQVSPVSQIINPTAAPITALGQTAVTFSFVPPAGITANVVDHSSTDMSSAEISLANTTGTFMTTIIDNAQKVPNAQLDVDPAKINARIYEYSPQDFETLAIVDGKELVVSRTGAADVMVVNSNERVMAIPELAAKTDANFGKKTEYYVYQKYNGGISEYLSIFQKPGASYPSKVNYSMITYSISAQSENANWQAHKAELKGIVEGMKKK